MFSRRKVILWSFFSSILSACKKIGSQGLKVESHSASDSADVHIKLDQEKNEGMKDLIISFTEYFRTKLPEVHKMRAVVEKNIMGPFENISLQLGNLDSREPPLSFEERHRNAVAIYREFWQKNDLEKIDSDSRLQRGFKEMCVQSKDNMSLRIEDAKKHAGIDFSTRVMLVSPPHELLRGLDAICSLLSTLHSPVGEYGEEFTRRLILSSAILLRFLAGDEFLKLSSTAEEKSRNVPLVRRGDWSEEYQEIMGDDVIKRPFLHGDGLRTFIEGIATFHQTLILLTAKKVPEFASPVELVRALIQPESDGLNGFIAKFASMAPPGFIAPTVQKGGLLREVIRMNHRKQIEITQSFRALLEPYKAACLNARAKKGIQVNDFVQPGCIGCPVTRPFRENPKKSGVQLLAETYLLVFNTL
jgi:hypothetical protein